MMFIGADGLFTKGEGVGICICWEFPKTGVPGRTGVGETFLWITLSTDLSLLIGGDINDLTYVLWDLIWAGGWAKGE